MIVSICLMALYGMDVHFVSVRTLEGEGEIFLIVENFLSPDSFYGESDIKQDIIDTCKSIASQCDIFYPLRVLVKFIR